jgi:hypothetical protein
MSPSTVAVGDWGATCEYLSSGMIVLLNDNQTPTTISSLPPARREVAIVVYSQPGCPRLGTRMSINSSRKTPSNVLLISTRNPNFSGSAFGYQGSLVLPRELFIKITADVTSPTVTQKGSWWSTVQSDGKHKIQSLGVRPASELQTLRKGATYHTLKPSTLSPGQTTSLTVMKTTSYELRTSVDFASSNALAGIVLRASNTTGEQTVITYNLATETLSIDRSNSSVLSFSPDAPAGSAAYIANYEEHGKLRLWEVNGKREVLDLTIYGRPPSSFVGHIPVTDGIVSRQLARGSLCQRCLCTRNPHLPLG